MKREGGGAETASVPGTPSSGSVPHKLLQPKTEFVEEPSNMEDVSLEDEEDYGPNPGTSQASFSSQGETITSINCLFSELGFGLILDSPNS